MEFNTHKDLQEKILNKLLVILGIITIPYLTFSILRNFDIGWQAMFYVHIAVAPTVILCAKYRKSLKYTFKIVYLISVMFILALASTFYLGLSGFLVEYLMLAVFIAVIFKGKKGGIVTYIMGAITILGSGLLKVYEFIPPLPQAGSYSTYLSSWLVTIAGFTFVTALVILVAGEIGHLLADKFVELRSANEEIDSLQKLLPICAKCKKIRDDKGFWNQVETYFHTHTDVKFTHGLCNECIDTLNREHEEELKST